MMKNIKIERVRKGYWIVKADTERFGIQEIMFEGIRREECRDYVRNNKRLYK